MAMNYTLLPTKLADVYGGGSFGQSVYSTSTASAPSTTVTTATTPLTTTAPVTAITSPFDLDPLAAFIDGSGYVINVQANQIYHYTLTTSSVIELHTITISDITANSITFILASTPRTVILAPGQQVLEDVTGDNTPDVGILAQSITPPTAQLKIWEIKPATKTVQTVVSSAQAVKSPSNAGFITAVIITAVAIVVLLGLVSRIWRHTKGSNTPPAPPAS